MSHFSEHDLDHILNKVPGLKHAQKEYIHGMFEAHDGYGGVNAKEQHKILKHLRDDKSDKITSYHIDHLERLLDEHHGEGSGSHGDDSVDTASESIKKSGWL